MVHEHNLINLEEEEEGQLSIDVYQTEDELVIQTAIAGVKLEDLEVLAQSDMLIIRGKRYPPENVKPEQYIYRECYWGPFSRTIILPRDVDTSQIKASLKDGILTIKLPKIQKSQFQKIDIKLE